MDKSIKIYEGDNVKIDSIEFSLGNVIKRWDNKVSARINLQSKSPLGGSFDAHDGMRIRFGKMIYLVEKINVAEKNTTGNIVLKRVRKYARNKGK